MLYIFIVCARANNAHALTKLYKTENKCILPALSNMNNNCQVCHKSKLKTHLNSFGQGDHFHIKMIWLNLFRKLKTKKKRPTVKIEK